MDILSNGQMLVQLRKRQGISQRELSRRTSIAQYRLSRFERDQSCPTKEEATKLRRFLGEKAGLRLELKHPQQAELLKAFRFQTPRLKLTTEVTLDSWRKRFGTLAQRLESEIAARPDRELCRAYLRECGAESADELQLSMHLLARAGSLPVWTSPVRVGFVKHPVVDRETGECAGSAIRAGLMLERAEAVLLLLPQATLRPRRGQFRLDFLVGKRTKDGVCWYDLEIDGRGHDAGYDEYRRESLELKTVRLSDQEVARWDCVDILLRRLA